MTCILTASEQSLPCKQTGIYRLGLREMHRHMPTGHPGERNLGEYPSPITEKYWTSPSYGLSLAVFLVFTPARVTAVCHKEFGLWGISSPGICEFLWMLAAKLCFLEPLLWGVGIAVLFWLLLFIKLDHNWDPGVTCPCSWAWFAPGSFPAGGDSAVAQRSEESRSHVRPVGDSQLSCFLKAVIAKTETSPLPSPWHLSSKKALLKFLLYISQPFASLIEYHRLCCQWNELR